MAISMFPVGMRIEMNTLHYTIIEDSPCGRIVMARGSGLNVTTSRETLKALLEKGIAKEVKN